MNGNMSAMRSDLDGLRSLSKDKHAEAMKRMDDQQKRFKDLGSLNMAVDNLFNRCFIVRKQNITKANLQNIDRIKNEPEAQKTGEMLLMLSQFYLDMKDIATKSKDHQRKPEQHFNSRVVSKEKKEGKAEGKHTTLGIGEPPKFKPEAPIAEAPNVLTRRDSTLGDGSRRKSVMSSQVSGTSGT